MHDNHFPHCCMIFERAHKSLLLLMNGCLKRKMFFVNLLKSMNWFHMFKSILIKSYCRSIYWSIKCFIYLFTL